MTRPPHLAAAVPAGDLLFLSGQLAFDADGRIDGDIDRQTLICLERLESVLRQHDLDRSAIVKVSVWLTDRAAFVAFNNAYALFFGDHRPARSTVISALAIDGALVEIDAIAARQDAIVTGR
jgi:2-iminobutanoate/2-iminopropanoate deaminase